MIGTPKRYQRVTIGMAEVPMLDVDFDDTNELVVEEPPIYATRRCGGRLMRLDYEPDDD